MCDLKVANFLYLRSLKPTILIKYLFENYFRSRAANIILIERLFVYFITLFLRRWYAKFK